MTKFSENRWEPKGGSDQIFLLVLETKKGGRGRVGWEVGDLSIRNLLNSLTSNSSVKKCTGKEQQKTGVIKSKK